MNRYRIVHDDFDPGGGKNDPDWTVVDTTMDRHEVWSFLSEKGAALFVLDREAYDRGERELPPASNDDRYL